MGLDVITKRVRKATVRERTKKAYTDPNIRPKLFAEPCKTCGAYPPVKLSGAGLLTTDDVYGTEFWTPKIEPTASLWIVDKPKKP